MDIMINPLRKDWAALCRRPSQEDAGLMARVEKIVERVRRGGDAALQDLSREIDGYSGGQLEVTEEEIERGCEAVGSPLREAMRHAADNIAKFHRAQTPREIEVETVPGVRCIQRPVPIDRVGLYIPGGTAPLFSTVLMLAVPARIAGCREVVLCTPPGRDGRVAGELLFAARLCGVGRVFRVGGAQAIAAMAYGTETIPAADKIFGPGNRYVTAAKQLLGGRSVSVDMPAGPSEVMVLADGSASPRFIASDLLSQAEHGPDSQVMLVCDSGDMAEAVAAEVQLQAAALERLAYVEKSLSKSRIIVLDSREDMVAFANAYAPEHLIISMEGAWDVAGGIRAAGSVFVGKWSPESAGDYASGTNHTLPTCGWARSCSGVNVDSFMRKMTLQELTRDGLESLAPIIVPMAEAEGLQAHANAVRIRLEDSRA